MITGYYQWIGIWLTLCLVSCGGGGGGGGGSSSPSGSSTSENTNCTGSCADANSFLTTDEVQQVIARAANEADARGLSATIAVVDRVGNVLGVFRMNNADTGITVTSNDGVQGGLENIEIIPDALAAIAKAVTGAYLSSEGNAFSSRTANQIVQSHFNPSEFGQPGGPLFGVQFSQLPCGDLVQRFTGAADVGPKRSPLGLSADPGGFPLYKQGTPIGAVGVVTDGTYGLDAVITDTDRSQDELVALAGTFGFAAPTDRRADRITVDGKLLRYSDVSYDDLSRSPGSAPAFAAINGVLGNLIAVTGYNAGVILQGTAFGQNGSGIRADALDFPNLNAFVLVNNANTERYRPQAGTDGANALTANEVTVLLRKALAVANRSRAQIRRPLNTTARVTISVIDTNGAILGVARNRDAPVFGTDVSLQKARAAVFFTNVSAADDLEALPNAGYLNSDGTAVATSIDIGDYVPAIRNFIGVPTALADGAIAFSNRALGNLARPFYPDGIDGNAAGPLSKVDGQWSPFSTGIQLDLVYNGIIKHVVFVLGGGAEVETNCTGITAVDAGLTATNPIATLANGIQIFPGSVPIYRGNTLIGGIGVSGDGVDQDDMVAFLGLDEAGTELGTISNAPQNSRADTLAPGGSSLRYVSCPQSPYVNSDEQEVCDGK